MPKTVRTVPSQLEYDKSVRDLRAALEVVLILGKEYARFQTGRLQIVQEPGFVMRIAAWFSDM
jgi:hypothetical protein